MGNHWKELLPVDRYTVHSNGIIRPDDLRVITMLYQPLIGAGAYSLYMTLYGELGAEEVTSIPSTHHSLMNHTQMNLQSIYEERKKLEAIGLLKTFQQKTEDERIFIYEIQPALDPEKFFQDDVLSIYLYGRLGKQRYVEVKKRFTYTQHEVSDYEEVTASFNDVFSSLHASEIRSGVNSEIHGTNDNQDTKYYKHNKGAAPDFSNGDFDFDTLVRDLSSFIIPSEVLTEELKDAIERLAFIYQISPLDMSSVVQQAYFRDEELTAAKLRKETQRWYKIEKPGQLPKLSERNQAPASLSKDSSAQTPEEMMIRTFETISPRTLLEKYSEGGRAASSDLKLVETVMFEQKLSSGVVNVLIDYVLNTNDMKLVHGYVEKIASQWKRKKITTVREAMALAKAEHQNYQSYKQQKSKPSGYRQKRTDVRKDTLPKWMRASKKSDGTSQKQEQPVTDNEKKWLEEYLKGL